MRSLKFLFDFQTLNVYPRFENGATVINCRTSENLLKILTELLGILKANLNNNEPLNVHVVNSVLDLIKKYIEHSSIVQNPDISKSFSNLQTQLSNAKAFSETGQLIPSTIDTISKFDTKPLQYYIPNANQPSCKDAFSKLIDTVNNAYSHVNDLNTCQSYRNNYAPMSYYEHSFNFLPNKPILQLPNQNLIQYLQNQKVNPGSSVTPALENYRPNNNKNLYLSYAQNQQPFLQQTFLTNNPINNPIIDTGKSDLLLSSILSRNTMMSSNQANASITPQMSDNDYLQSSPEQVSVQGQTIPNPARFAISRYSNKHSTVIQPLVLGNTPDLQRNKMLPNVTYKFMPLQEMQYPNIPSQQQYIQKPMNLVESTDNYNVPSFFSPAYRQMPLTVYKNPYPTSKLENQSPPLQNDVLHKFLQAMKLTKVFKTPTNSPKTNQDNEEYTRTLPNNKALPNVYSTIPNNIVQDINNLRPITNRNLNNPIQYQPAYGNITPQIHSAQQFSSTANYNYQVNSLAQQQIPYNLVPNLPVGNVNPYIQKTPSETAIPIILQNPNINQQLNIPISSPNPNDLKTSPVVLPALTQEKLNQAYFNQYLHPGFGNQIASQQNQINQPTQSRINNNILNQSQREVQNFTVYSKTPNLNQISGVPNLKELNNVPSKTSIIELIYLLHQKVPITYSYVKYKIPFMVLKNILQQKSAQKSDTQELHKQLASNSEIEVSPELMFGSKEQIAQLVSTNGTFMSAIIVNGTDYSVKGLSTRSEGLPNQTLSILPLQRINTRKHMPEDAMIIKDLTKVLSDIQNLNSKIKSGRMLGRENITAQIEVGSKKEPINNDSTTPIEV